MVTALALDEAVRKVAPIEGVSIGRRDDKSTWRVDFRPEATKAERRAAAAVIDAFEQHEEAGEEARPEASVGEQLAALKAVLIQKHGLDEADIDAQLALLSSQRTDQP